MRLWLARARLAAARANAESDTHTLEAKLAAAKQTWDATEGHPLQTLADRHQLPDFETEALGFMLAVAYAPEVLDRAPLDGRGVCIPRLMDLVTILDGNTLPARLHAQRLLAPDGALRRRRLVEAVHWDRTHLLAAPLLLTRPVFAHLTGTAEHNPLFRVEQHTGGFPDLISPHPDRTEAFRRHLAGMLEAHRNQDLRITDGHRGFAVLVWGKPESGRQNFVRAVSQSTFSALVAVDGAALAGALDPGRQLALVFDHAAFHQAAVMVANADKLLADPMLVRLLVHHTEMTPTCVFVVSERRDAAPQLESMWQLVMRVEEPTHSMGTMIWESAIPHDAEVSGDVDLTSLAERFSISAHAVRRSTRQALAYAGIEGKPVDMGKLEEAATQQLESDLGALVQTIYPHHEIEDLVLPRAHLLRVEQIINASRVWHHVMGQWGFGARLATGKCVSCLFAGPPGTGKTLAAEIVAHTLGEALHIVALPSLMSKWVGESERNIRTLFARAKNAGAVLLFDEADALFTQRVEVQSSQDNFRNMLTGLLLQELDRHTGLVILTTNLAKNIDQAFQRRIMFNLEFPQPDASLRARIWRRLAPRAMPAADDIDYDQLARDYELSGGEIKNAILRAALAAWDDTCVTHAHLEEACMDEYRHTGRLIRGENGTAESLGERETTY